MSSVAAATTVRNGIEVSEQSRARAAYNAGIALFFLAVSYTQVFVLPNIAPSPGMDSVIFLCGGARMAAGQAIYRDFFELTYPGTELYYAAMFRIFGVRAWIPAATMVVLGAATAWMMLLIARQIFKTEAQALLVGVATIAFPVFFAPDATHRWFSGFFVLTAVWSALQERRGRAFVAGALCGVAAMFTQTSGLMAAVAITCWVVWNRRNWRDGAAVFVTFAVTLLTLCGYFVAGAGPRVFWYSTVTFVLHNYGSVPWNGPTAYFHALPSRALKDLPETLAFGLVHAMDPLVYVLFAARFLRERKFWPEKPWRALMLIELVGIALFLTVAKSASEKRLTMTCLPAMLLLVWLLHQEGKVELWARRVFLAATAAVLIAGPIMRQVQMRSFTVMELPVGRTAVRGRDIAEMLGWLGPRTSPGELSFGHPPFEFLMRLRSAAYVPYANPGDYTPPDQVRLVIDALERQHVPLVITSAMAYLPRPNSTDHLAPLRAYVSQNYRMVKISGTSEVWLRKGVEFPSVR